ncbi:gp299 [Sphingomonas phage PAU]|uniref:gp299 n=1 Tax=Sphingomonas phage PAU TaxID=1150991 RepID=UPI00025734AA|nr:gp299 [Sphingomonas phage PAU]AFF28296.1 gp299 [Sphingomonas phage PAU]
MKFDPQIYTVYTSNEDCKVKISYMIKVYLYEMSLFGLMKTLKQKKELFLCKNGDEIVPLRFETLEEAFRFKRDLNDKEITLYQADKSDTYFVKELDILSYYNFINN